MATQGLISILERNSEPCNDKVIYKIVAGCDGHLLNLQRLTDKLQKLFNKRGMLTVQEIYRVAQRHVGCEACLVVMDNNEIYFKGEEDPGIDKRYRETFDQPCFNPRWKQGTADAIQTLIFTKGVLVKK